MHPSPTLTQDAPPSWRAAVDDDHAPLLAVLKITWPHEQASTERDPWTITLSTGYTTIIWTPLSAAVQLENEGYAIRAASAADHAHDLARSRSLPALEFIACARCTRADRCANHAQHGQGCHCRYRGDFFRAARPGGTEVLCTNHLRHAHDPASLVKLAIA